MKRTLKGRNKALFLTQVAIIAASYVILTLISGMLGLDGKGIIQVRISEALCILPIFTSAAIPGVTLGCFIYNILFCSPLDAVLGTLATLIGLLALRFIPLFKKHIMLAGIPTVFSNTLIIPFVTALVYTDGTLASVPYLMPFVFIGEIISCMLIGSLLAYALKKHEKIFFSVM